jgi:predicted TIM-barrel fold metal-dependent hydrolase
MDCKARASRRWLIGVAFVVALAASLAGALRGRRTSLAAAATRYEVDDVHLHLTNYVQEGINIRDLLTMMDDRVGRAALFGIPLQQMWSYENSKDNAPKYYLDTDAPLYYYSFTDAVIATAYGSLSAAQKARFDPMITGFNPADMYAADHIRRVLQTYPGVFSGIGEFSIHKEFVSSKIAGGPPSLSDPALDRIFDFAAEAGLVVLIHNDVDRPFAKGATTSAGVPQSEPRDAQPTYLEGMKQLVRRHPGATVVWAHVGLGRVVFPLKDYVVVVADMLEDPSLKQLSFDISWDEVAKYLLATPETTGRAADLINRFPDRFLYGSDVVAPASREALMEIYDAYAPLWARLTPQANEKVKRGNYERIFDAARVKVRAWEKAHPK